MGDDKSPGGGTDRLYGHVLNQQELAEVLGVSRRTIQRALAAGKPLGGWKAIQVGDRVKFTREDSTATHTP